jgi:hypothetical protein
VTARLRNCWCRNRWRRDNWHRPIQLFAEHTRRTRRLRHRCLLWTPAWQPHRCRLGGGGAWGAEDVGETVGREMVTLRVEANSSVPPTTTMGHVRVSIHEGGLAGLPCGHPHRLLQRPVAIPIAISADWCHLGHRPNGRTQPRPHQAATRARHDRPDHRGQRVARSNSPLPSPS